MEVDALNALLHTFRVWTGGVMGTPELTTRLHIITHSISKGEAMFGKVTGGREWLYLLK